MRVLLINPPYPVVESLTMPLGLLYLAARLEQAGREVHLEDLQLCRSPLTRLEEALHQNQPAVAGITSFSLNLSVASKILQKVKRLSPETVTVWGGPHVSFDDREILHQHPWVDVVVRGEGEETLAEVVDRVRQGKSLDGVLGITWRGKMGISRTTLPAFPGRPGPTAPAGLASPQALPVPGFRGRGQSHDFPGLPAPLCFLRGPEDDRRQGKIPETGSRGG